MTCLRGSRLETFVPYKLDILPRGCPVIGRPLTNTADGKFIGKWLPPSWTSYSEWSQSYRGASRVIANFHNQIAGCLYRLSDELLKVTSC